MTIINPNTAKSLRSFFLLIIFITLVAGLIYIREYNLFVNIRNERSQIKKMLVDLQTKNADLKNALYLVIEPKKLEAIAKANGLVLERLPEYLNSGKWLSDSSH